MTKRIAILGLILMILLSACSASRADEQAGMDGGTTGSYVMEGEMAREDMAMPEEAPAAAEPQTPGKNGERIVLRSASLTIVVPEPAQAMDSISRMAENMNGFVVSSNLYKAWSNTGVEVPEATVTIRVPSERLNEALSQIKSLVKDPDNDVDAETISGQDVTAEYTDLNSRLTNLQAAEEQLRQIMEEAVRTEDVLAVYNELIQIRSEIEVLQGQIRYYSEAAALSSISVQIRAEAALAPIEVGGWKPVGIARDALQALLDTGQFLASAVIWFVIYVLPVGLLIGLLVWIAIRVLRRVFGRKPAVTPPPAP